LADTFELFWTTTVLHEPHCWNLALSHLNAAGSFGGGIDWSQYHFLKPGPSKLPVKISTRTMPALSGADSISRSVDANASLDVIFIAAEMSGWHKTRITQKKDTESEHI
jgi:hypothetical protein